MKVLDVYRAKKRGNWTEQALAMAIPIPTSDQLVAFDKIEMTNCWMKEAGLRVIAALYRSE